MAIGRKQGVTVRGMDELVRKLKALPAVVEAASKISVKAETEETADDMRRGAPFLHGELRESIGAEFDAKTITGRATATSKHAGFVEHGTSDTPAQPFVGPAASRARRRFPGRVENDLKAELRKLAR